jgi:RHS repeat-associated protein
MSAKRLLTPVIIFMIILTPVAFASSITTYTYDANGNMISDGKFNYTYNAANQMTTAIKADTGDFVEEYYYDHSGNRIKKIESATGGNKTTYYVSGLYEVTVEPDGTTTNTTYVYANGERVAKNETNENGSTVFYYHSDHLHSTSVVTTQGNLIANLTEANSNWTTITLEKSLARPVVVAKITSENDTDNCEIRITNTSSDSFIIKVEETDVFDGTHANETVSYIALEEGIIANGATDLGEAGTVETGPIWTRVTFEEAFDDVPVVIASPMTYSDANAGAGAVRVRNVYKTGFEVRFEEYDGPDHPLETIGWIALKPGTHTLDGKTIVAGSVSTNSNYSSVSLSGFSATPAVITQIQSYNEADYASHTRLNNTNSTGFEIKIEEQNDTEHASETVGYIAIEPTTLKSGHAKVSETKYYPYGVIQEGGSERYLYTGKEMDAGTGLYYYEARYYSPSVGRFIQPDTIIPDPYNPQALNRYSYVLNNPLRYTDPSGHDWKTVYHTEGHYNSGEGSGGIVDDLSRPKGRVWVPASTRQGHYQETYMEANVIVSERLIIEVIKVVPLSRSLISMIATSAVLSSIVPITEEDLFCMQFKQIYENGKFDKEGNLDPETTDKLENLYKKFGEKWGPYSWSWETISKSHSSATEQVIDNSNNNKPEVILDSLEDFIWAKYDSFWKIPSYRRKNLLIRDGGHTGGSAHWASHNVEVVDGKIDWSTWVD